MAQEYEDPFAEMREVYSTIPILNGKTVKEHVGISDEDMFNLHALACHFYERGKLNEAETYFRQLALMETTNMDYIMGLGAVLQKKKLYAQAVDCYAAAHMLQTRDSRPMFHCGQCHFFDRKYTKAKICFQTVVEQNFSEDLVKMADLFIKAIDKSMPKEAEDDD